MSGMCNACEQPERNFVSGLYPHNDEDSTRWDFARIDSVCAVSEAIWGYETPGADCRPRTESHFLAGQGKNALWSSLSQMEQT